MTKKWLDVIRGYPGVQVKLTNNELDKSGQIVLNSMHKFQPRVHLVLVAGPGPVTDLAKVKQSSRKIDIFGGNGMPDILFVPYESLVSR